MLLRRRSNKEQESVKDQGDVFTWEVSLEAGAAIHSVMFPDLVKKDITTRQGFPPEDALRLRILAAISVRLASTLETSYPGLLRLLVSEFCLNDYNNRTSARRVFVTEDPNKGKLI